MSLFVLKSLVLIVTTHVATGKSYYGKTTGCDSRCQQECIEVLNTYRANHNAPNLTFSQDLANQAQSWAEGGQFGYDMNLRGKYGQLIEWDVKNELPSFTAAIKYWHDKEKEYDFQEGKSNNGKTLHDFTQVVWKKAMHAGCGLGKLFGARYYVVWMDADGVVSPNLGIGRENIGDPKQEDVNWFQESLRHNTSTTFSSTTDEDKQSMNQEEQTETIDDITTSTDDNEAKVLNNKVQKIKYVPTLSRSEQSVTIGRGKEADTKPFELFPPTQQISRGSSDLRAEKNRSHTSNQYSQEEQKMQLQSVNNFKQKSSGNNTNKNKLDDSMFPRENIGSLYARFRAVSQGSTSLEKTEDGDDIQDVSSEVKTAYSGKEGLTNELGNNPADVPLHQFPPDSYDNSSSSEPGYQERSDQKEVLDPESTVLQRLVDGSSEKIKLNNDPNISRVGGPITSISAVGVPVSYSKERSASSPKAIKMNSPNSKTSEKTAIATNNSSLILEETRKEKLNTTKQLIQFPYSQLKTLGYTKVSGEPKPCYSTTRLSHMKQRVNGSTDLSGKTQNAKLSENVPNGTSAVTEALSSATSQNHAIITPLISKNAFLKSVTAGKSLGTGNKTTNIGAQNEKQTEWNTISENGKLNFSLKFPFKKNTSIESADHLIRVKVVSGAAHRETVGKRITGNPSVTETKASDRTFRKLQPPPIPLNIAAFTAKCHDATDRCRLWAQHGQCKDVAYMEYMREHCKQTCGYCGLPEVLIESELPVQRQSLLENKVCQDSREHQFSCPLWSYHGYCEKKQSLMELFCRKSCDLCGEHSSVSSFSQETKRVTSGHLTTENPIVRSNNEMDQNPTQAMEGNTIDGVTDSPIYGTSGTEDDVGTSEVNDGELASRYSLTDSGTKRNENMIMEDGDVGVTRGTGGIRHHSSAVRKEKIGQFWRKEALKGHPKPVSTAGCDTSCQNECLQAHNAYRFNHGASPLRLSQRLSDQAQAWANRKVFKHSPWASGQGGESIALGGLYPSFTAAVKAWHDEEKDYDWSTGKARGQANVAHFAQVVWKKATLLGCGRSLVNNEPFYIAQMDIPGVVTDNLQGYGRDNIGTPLKDDTNWFMESSPYWKELQEKNSIPSGVDHYIL